MIPEMLNVPPKNSTVDGRFTLYLGNVICKCDDTAANTDTFTMGIAGQYAPRYSGSNHQFFQVLPVIQGRKGAFFVDSEKGLGYDLQADNGLYLEHSLGYSLGRSDRNSNWRDGANELKGMGNIKAAMNTALAVGWSIAPWVSIEGKAILPVTDSQGRISGFLYAYSFAE
jgi:outer membrane scaffolding protein for murein synthesis (MipA/OmpV family)